MVEIRLESADGSGAAMAKDFYVSVRLGETQKLSKFSGARVYRFPDGGAAGAPRSGSIEVFQRLGHGSVDVDTGNGLEPREVKIACGAELLAFRVHLENVPASKEQLAEERSVKKEVKKKSAKDYLNKYGIEARLTEAMSNVLRERPEDPAAFIAAELLRGRTAEPTTLPPADEPEPAPAPPQPTASPPAAAAAATPAPEAARASGSPEPVILAPVAESTPAPPREVEAPPGQVEAPLDFPLTPSVGTWLAKPPRALGSGSMATRSLRGFGPAASMPLLERCEVERIVTKALIRLKATLDGEYLPLPSSVSYAPRPGGMDASDQAALQQDGLSFSASDPNGRGVFVLKDRGAAIMVNSMEQHVTLVALPQASIEVESLASALSEALKQDGQELL